MHSGFLTLLIFLNCILVKKNGRTLPYTCKVPKATTLVTFRLSSLLLLPLSVDRYFQDLLINMKFYRYFWRIATSRVCYFRNFTALNKYMYLLQPRKFTINHWMGKTYNDQRKLYNVFWHKKASCRNLHILQNPVTSGQNGFERVGWREVQHHGFQI